MKLTTLAIVGVGLIGGSLGLAAKKRRLAQRVLGMGRNRVSLQVAQAAGAIDEAFLDLSDAVASADAVVFCTPVDRIAEQVLTAAAVCRPGTLMTDAGSTKAGILRAVKDRLPPGVTFIGSHPLAGSEKRGPEYADPDLFQDRLTVVTPTKETPLAEIERVLDFWRALGSRVKIMAPEEHDQALALTSHLPHLVASALAGILPPELHELTATGFRDSTRIAASDPELWTAIFVQNDFALLDAVARLQERLEAFKAALLTSDWVRLRSLLAKGKEVRDALGS
jgi:prephenate dehydrogenase